MKKALKLLDGFLNQQGYIILRARNKLIPLHKYIWNQYHGKVPKNLEVHHKDGNILNNTIENLELVTKIENLKKRKWSK